MRRIKGGMRHERGDTEREGADDKGWMAVQTHADEGCERLEAAWMSLLEAKEMRSAESAQGL